MTATDTRDAVLRQVDELEGELVDFCQRLIRLPTVNPPGENYLECAELIGRELETCGFSIEYLTAEARPEHSEPFPRTNVIGRLPGRSEHPALHVNGHFDVVPAGDGWTRDPFGGEIEDGILYGRGSADMKAGLAAALYAAEAIRRAGITLDVPIEVSGTVDEESGGLAGAAYLAECGRITADNTAYAIIPEPFSPHRVCIGHRGVYWAKITATGHIAHGSMPWLGTNAIDSMGPLLEALRTELQPAIAERLTNMPVVPEDARRGSLNINAIAGGQYGQPTQTPCVADHCELIIDRRYLLEEGFDATRAEILELIDRVAGEDERRRFDVEDMLIVHPTQAPDGSPLVAALEESIEHVTSRPAEIVASPGTYDQKHFARIGGVEHCVAYGPGTLEEAHQPDEHCAVSDIVDSAKVMALTLLKLGTG